MLKGIYLGVLRHIRVKIATNASGNRTEYLPKIATNASGNRTKYLPNIATNASGNRTEYLPNISLERYQSTNRQGVITSVPVVTSWAKNVARMEEQNCWLGVVGEDKYLDRKFPAFYGIRRFITGLTRVSHSCATAVMRNLSTLAAH
jgi:hypothetical protein